MNVETFKKIYAEFLEKKAKRLTIREEWSLFLSLV